jgi:hypothetical protein
MVGRSSGTVMQSGFLFDGPDGSPVIHNLPMYRSTGLTTWQYAGDAFTDKPSWVAPAACGRPT